MSEKIQDLKEQLFGDLPKALNVRKVNCIERLEKINQRVNELVDLLMRWNRGDEEALQVLESQITTKKVRGWKDIQWLKEYKFTAPAHLQPGQWMRLAASSCSSGKYWKPFTMTSGPLQSFRPGCWG
jgi:hypothetical protein